MKNDLFISNFRNLFKCSFLEHFRSKGSGGSCKMYLIIRFIEYLRLFGSIKFLLS